MVFWCKIEKNLISTIICHVYMEKITMFAGEQYGWIPVVPFTDMN